MELRKGYKQTEVGAIPEDWEVKPIGELLSIKHGKDQKAVKSVDGIYPIYGTGGLMGYATEYLYDKESVLIGRKGTIDQPMYMDTPFWTVDTLFYSEVEKEYNAKYIYYNFLLIDWYAHNEASGVPSLNARTIEKILFPLPPTLAEQTAIATALSDMDKLIAGLEQLIEKKKAIKQGAMQELLRPKEGWVVKKLGEIGEIIGGGTPSTFNPQYWNGNINWFTPTEVGLRKYLYESERKITKAGIDSSSARLLPKGTVLLTTRAGIGDVGILKNEASTNQGFQSIVVNEKNDNEFVYYLLTTLKPELLRNASGSTFLEISPIKLKAIEVCIPNREEQNKISECLVNMDQELFKLEEKLAKYKLLKQGMMQELLTGKTRLL